MMRLEEQLARLANLGLELEPGITLKDILSLFDREAYEEPPFDLILFVLGTGVESASGERPVCSRAWNFDMECIGSTGDYVDIVKRLCHVAGQPDRLTDVSDFVDIDRGQAWLKYKVDATERNWPVEVRDDWADAQTISYVMGDIERDGRRFYFKDNGQAMILFYFDARTAAELNRLSSNALKPVLRG